MPVKNSLNSLKYASTEHYYMTIAYLTSKRSCDPETQVGACLVDQNDRIISTGFNSFPKSCSNYDFPWGKSESAPLENKHLYVLHAEANAILSANVRDLRNARMFVTMFPCNECAKMILEKGIKEIFYISDKRSNRPYTKASKYLLENSEVKVRKFDMSGMSEISFEFKEFM